MFVYMHVHMFVHMHAHTCLHERSGRGTITVAEETYCSVKRDLLQCQKRPMYTLALCQGYYFVYVCVHTTALGVV